MSGPFPCLSEGRCVRPISMSVRGAMCPAHFHVCQRGDASDPFPCLSEGRCVRPISMSVRGAMCPAHFHVCQRGDVYWRCVVCCGCMCTGGVWCVVAVCVLEVCGVLWLYVYWRCVGCCGCMCTGGVWGVVAVCVLEVCGVLWLYVYWRCVGCCGCMCTGGVWCVVAVCVLEVCGVLWLYVYWRCVVAVCVLEVCGVLWLYVYWRCVGCCGCMCTGGVWGVVAVCVLEVCGVLWLYVYWRCVGCCGCMCTGGVWGVVAVCVLEVCAVLWLCVLEVCGVLCFTLAVAIFLSAVRWLLFSFAFVFVREFVFSLDQRSTSIISLWCLYVDQPSCFFVFFAFSIFFLSDHLLACSCVVLPAGLSIPLGIAEREQKNPKTIVSAGNARASSYVLPRLS